MKKSKEESSKNPKSSKGWTSEERNAIQEYAREKSGVVKVEGEDVVLAKIAEMAETDRTLSKRLHGIIKANAPSLTPRLWYGMPAYANQDGKVVCYFQPAMKFKTRYATLGFSDKANLDEGSMWPVVYALKKLSPTEEAKIVTLVKKATL